MIGNGINPHIAGHFVYRGTVHVMGYYIRSAGAEDLYSPSLLIALNPFLCPVDLNHRTRAHSLCPQGKGIYAPDYLPTGHICYISQPAGMRFHGSQHSGQISCFVKSAGKKVKIRQFLLCLRAVKCYLWIIFYLLPAHFCLTAVGHDDDLAAGVD